MNLIINLIFRRTKENSFKISGYRDLFNVWRIPIIKTLVVVVSPLLFPTTGQGPPLQIKNPYWLYLYITFPIGTSPIKIVTACYLWHPWYVLQLYSYNIVEKNLITLYYGKDHGGRDDYFVYLIFLITRFSFWAP